MSSPAWKDEAADHLETLRAQKLSADALAERAAIVAHLRADAAEHRRFAPGDVREESAAFVLEYAADEIEGAQHHQRRPT